MLDRNNGQEVSAQMYPSQYGATGLHALLPPWQQEGGLEAMVARLQDPDTRAQIRQEIYGEIPTDPFFNFVMITAGGNWEKIKLVFAVVEENQVFVGPEGPTLHPRAFGSFARVLGYFAREQIIYIIGDITYYNKIK